jgi:hypothetical protein
MFASASSRRLLMTIYLSWVATVPGNNIEVSMLTNNVRRNEGSLQPECALAKQTNTRVTPGGSHTSSHMPSSHEHSVCSAKQHMNLHPSLPGGTQTPSLPWHADGSLIPSTDTHQV